MLFEVDDAAQKTLVENGLATASLVEWSRSGGDVRLIDWSSGQYRHVRLLAGGVPCQPFSLGGKHKAYDDKRNLFPEFFRAAAELKPATMLVENVGGLLRRTFRAYFGYILRRFENPFLSPKKRESWREHDERLRVCQCAMSYEQPYVVSWRRLNAADFGVPQQRKRVFIVAVRNDIGYYRFPAPTHSKQALLVDDPRHRGCFHRRERRVPAVSNSSMPR